ncbi:MAG: hypothetical protein U0894_12545 [Pirellulales bacterium]
MERHDDDGILDKKIDGKKTDFEFTVLTSNRPDRVALCNLLAESLEKVKSLQHTTAGVHGLN